jgi:phospholipid/cholesterol/gamma-HCH transport system ATP-binding protein
VIDIINLHKAFNNKHVLSGVNLHVERGETMVVIGGSGSGKSVLIKHVIGLLSPDEGSVIIDGVDISHLREKELNEFRKKYGMLFQGAALFDSLSVWENVGFGLMQHTDMSRDEIKEAAKRKLEMVGLKNIEDLMPSELSGGMRKRVGLARAIAMEPEIILYDEPTTGLDPIMSDAINDLIIEMKKKLNVTSIAITHDMVSAYKIGDKIAMLFEGKILEVGTPDDIRSSVNPVVRQFITGSSVGPIKTV